jgi:ribosomal protein S2
MLSTGLDYDYEAETLAILSRKNIPSEVVAENSRKQARQFIAARLIPGALTGPPTQRYEAHLHRQWLQTQHELEAMQARRRGESTPLARLDVISAPNGS